MSAVTPRFKENWGECGCGCGRSGTYRVKEWRNGVRCVKSCRDCANCRGKANRSRGDAAGRKARRVLNLGGAATRHEEGWGGAIRTEVKAGAKGNVVWTAYRACEDQSEQARAIGDTRPFVASFAPTRGPLLLVMRADQLSEIAAAVMAGEFESAKRDAVRDFQSQRNTGHGAPKGAA